MNTVKDERMKEIVRDLAARFIAREANQASLITVTRVELLNRGKEAIIFFTTLPNHKEPEAIDFLKRRRSEFRAFIKETSRLSRIPFIDFELDTGERNRQRIDEISTEANSK